MDVADRSDQHHYNLIREPPELPHSNIALGVLKG